MSLDLSEGVPWAYEKWYLPVEVGRVVGSEWRGRGMSVGEVVGLLERGADAEILDTSVRGLEDGGPGASSSSTVQQESAGGPQQREKEKEKKNEKAKPVTQVAESDLQDLTENFCSPQDSTTTTATVTALVYTSPTYTQEGCPRDEYIQRMNAGISDARRLGVSKAYIEWCMRRYIPRQGDLEMGG